MIDSSLTRILFIEPKSYVDKNIWVEEFNATFGMDWIGNDYRLPDFNQPKVKCDDVKSFIRFLLQKERERIRGMIVVCLMEEDTDTFPANELDAAKGDGYNECVRIINDRLKRIVEKI